MKKSISEELRHIIEEFRVRSEDYEHHHNHPEHTYSDDPFGVGMACGIDECADDLEIFLNSNPWIDDIVVDPNPVPKTSAKERVLATIGPVARALMPKGMVDIEIALEESIKLQSHYARLLNQYDGGERMMFKTPMDWIERLKKTGTIPDHKALETALNTCDECGWTQNKHSMKCSRRKGARGERP